MKRWRAFFAGPGAGWASQPWRLALFGGCGLTAFWFGFVAKTAAEAGELIQQYGYYAMAATFGWWLVALFRLRRAGGDGSFPSRHWWRTHRAVGGVIAGFTLVAWLTMPYSYKVLYDEIVLQTTAWSIHYFREFGTMWRGYQVEGVFHALGVYVDKRPFFYPFVVSLVHDLTGYRVANAFVLNTLLMPVVLGLLYWLLGKVAGGWARWTAFVCFGTSVLLAQNANGSGMEMLNLTMFLLTLGLAVYYLEQPAADRLSALILSCVLLAQTRYESALYVVPAAVVIVEGWRRGRRVVLPPAALVAPLLLIPCGLHNTYLAGTPSLWELRADVPQRFEAKYLAGNLERAAAYFFDFSSQLLSSWWLSVVGFWALGTVLLALGLRKWSWRQAAPAPVVALVFGVAVLGNVGLLMFYFWGQLDDPIVARLILPFTIMMTLAIAWCVEQIPGAWRKTVAAWLIVGALATYLGFGMKAVTYNRTINQLADEIAWEEQWLARQPPAARLIITNKTTLSWVNQGIPSLSIPDARNKADRVQFHLEAGTFQEVLVSQFYRPVNGEGGFVLDPRDELPAAFVLEPLIERQIGGRLLRISRVVSIRLPLKVEPPAPMPAVAGLTVATTESLRR